MKAGNSLSVKMMISIAFSIISYTPLSIRAKYRNIPTKNPSSKKAHSPWYLKHSKVKKSKKNSSSSSYRVSISLHMRLSDDSLAKMISSSSISSIPMKKILGAILSWNLHS